MYNYLWLFVFIIKICYSSSDILRKSEVQLRIFRENPPQRYYFFPNYANNLARKISIYVIFHQIAMPTLHFSPFLQVIILFFVIAFTRKKPRKVADTFRNVA